MLTGLYFIVNIGLLCNEDPNAPGFQIHAGEAALTAHQRVLGLMIGLQFAYAQPLMIAFWLSLKQASVLVSDQVIEVRKLIFKTSATSAEWDAQVVPELLKLIEVTLPALSPGWADGLLVLWSCMWVFVLGAFAIFLETGGALFLFFIVWFACFPLLLAADVAGASSDCDTLKTTLNDKRAASKYDVDVDAKLTAMETHLAYLNSCAGLSFIVAGKVVDRTSLKTIFVQVFGPLSTEVPLILTLKPKAFVAGSDACAAMAAEIAIARATFTNASCSYTNVTVGSLLALKTDDAAGTGPGRQTSRRTPRFGNGWT